jgi:ankyrin repeat protein
MKSQTLSVLFATMLLMMAACTPPEEKRLIELIKDGNSELAIEMINNGADVNARDSIQRTPLHAAARQNKIEVMELLISKGADLEARVVGTQVTPLFDAVMGGSKEAVQLLLDKGANVNAKTPAGETAAAYATDPAIAELLGKTVDEVD